MENKKNTKEEKSRLYYVIISIILSIAIWTYVAFVVNPDETMQLDNIRIEYIGEDVLKENNLMITATDTDTLSLTFTGKRNTLAKFDSTNAGKITAIVDLSEIVTEYSATAGLYQLPYEIDYAGTINENSVNVSNYSKNYVGVTVEKITNINIPVTLKNEVTAAEGYMTDAPTLSVNSVSISGPQSLISTIKDATVEVKREEVTSALTENVPIVLWNKNSEIVDMTHITMDKNIVTVTVPVLTVKDIPLAVELVNTTVATMNTATVKVDPTYVTLAGEESVIKALDKLLIGQIDLKTFALEKTTEFEIVIPDGLKNVSGETAASVNVKLDGLTTKVVTSTNIQLRNKPLNKEVTSKTMSVTVQLRGTREALNSVKQSDIRITADLSTFRDSVGTFSVPVKIYIDNHTDVDVLGEYFVSVHIA